MSTTKKINFFEVYNVPAKKPRKFEFGGKTPNGTTPVLSYQDGGVLNDDIINMIDQVRQSQDPQQALQVVNAIADQLGIPAPEQSQPDQSQQMGQPQQAQQQPMYKGGGKMAVKACGCNDKDHDKMKKGGTIEEKKKLTALEKMRMAKTKKPVSSYK